MTNWRLEEVDNHQKVIRYIIANTGRVVLVLVDFQDKEIHLVVLNTVLYN